jgi:hypothetical protein
MRLFTRRRFIVAVGTCAVGVGAGTAARAAGAPSTVTLWQLNPDWGEPLTTATGSDTKTRCRGRACHLAAPHRFFLTEADAIASRLHPCCLAQPVPVRVCIDLNELMPYYRARLGGVDARCPELPPQLRDALYAAGACVVTGGPGSGADPDEPATPDQPTTPDPPDQPDQPEEPDPPVTPTPPGTPSSPEGPGTSTDPRATTPTPLPSTGSGTTARLLATATAVTAAGVGLAMVSDRQEASTVASADGPGDGQLSP